MFKKRLKLSALLCAISFTHSAFPSIIFSGVDGSLGLNSSNSKLSIETDMTFSDGTLKLKSLDGSNLSGGSNIIMDGNASIATNDHTVYINGTLVPGSGSTADTITLNNGDVLSANEGNAVEQIVSVAPSSTATILGSPVFTGTITLASDSVLNLGVNQKLNSSIDLGMGGKVVLLDDLYLKNGVQFINNGTVDCDKSALVIGSIQGASPWTNTIAFQRAYDVRLLGDLAITGVWQFLTNGSDNFSTVNGNASMIDLSAGGSIEVDQNHTLYLSDLTIKLGTTGGLTFTAGANPGKFVLSNVTFLLTGNYTQSGGEIHAKGDNVRFISGGNKTWTISGSDSKLTADGVVVIYETLGGPNIYPFVTSTGGTISFINGATLRSAISEVVVVDVNVDSVANNGSTVTLTNNYELVTVSKINVTNTSGTAKTVTIDGSNYVWRFAGSSIPAINVANDTTVTLQNVILKNFQPDAVTVGTSSSLLFGDGCVLEIDGNIFNNFSGAFNQIYCTGNVTIRGVKSAITLDSASTVVQATAGKTLTFDNVTLYWNHDTGLACLTDTSKITLKDCTVLLKRPSSDKYISIGNLDIVGYCKMRSAIVDSSFFTADIIYFHWYSKGLLTVTSGSTLEIGKGINFHYAPNITGLSVSDQKRRLLLADNSSTLILNNCKVWSDAPGIAFDQGNLVIDNRVFVASSTVPSDSLEIAPAVNIEVNASAILTVDGGLQL